MNMLLQLPVHVAPRGLPPITETMPPAIERLIREVNPEKIILFGSYAYGNPTPDSDVDLLVIVTPKKGETRRERYLRVALALTPRWFPADIIVHTPEEIEKRLQHSFFLREILSKGKILYARK
ncbi:MAG: nucleotidyltransferase domain-containing protein [Chloroflexota bacterium]